MIMQEGNGKKGRESYEKTIKMDPKYRDHIDILIMISLPKADAYSIGVRYAIRGERQKSNDSIILFSYITRWKFSK